MKILFVWDADYPWDIRIEKICATLIENGWDVHLVCRNKSRKVLDEVYNGIHIHRVPYLQKKLGALNNIFTFPMFFSPIWLARINTIAKSHNIDVIMVRDLPMALAAITIAKLRKLPVVLDMAECYPEFVRLIWKFEPFKFRNILVRNPFLVDFIERLVLKHVNHIFVMIEESKDRLIKKGINTDKITIVSNTPVTQRFKEAKLTFPGLLNKKSDKLILLYVGFVNQSRGLNTVIESLKHYKEMNNDFFLVVLGTGNAEKSLKELVKKLGLEHHVGFEGWVDNKLVPEYVASSDICLVPHHKCGHWNNTIPNKLFDYMVAGKPVLVSDVYPMKRITENVECGLVYRDYDTQDFVSQLVSLQDQKLRNKLGQNGMKVVESYYNWDTDSARILKCLEELKKT